MAYGLDEIYNEGNRIMPFYKFWDESRNCEWYDRGRCAKEVQERYKLPERNKNLVGPWRVYKRDLEEIYSRMEEDILNEDWIDEETHLQIDSILDRISDLIGGL